MRFRKDKGDGGGADAPTEAIAAPPPSAAERVEEPTAVQPAEPAKPHGDPLTSATPPSGYPVPTEEKPSGDGPQSPAPSGPQSPAPAPHGDPLAGAAPPTRATRVDSPAPAGAKVLADPPSADARVEAPPPQPGQLVAAAPPDAAAVACPQCGTPAEQGQEMCIVCGSRIAATSAGPGTSRGWRGPALIAGLAACLIGVAIAFAVVELTKDDDVKKDDVADLSPTTSAPPAGGAPPPATPPPASTTPAPPTTPEIPPASGGTQPETPNTEPEDTAPDSTGPAEWPEGKTAYTVVLVSATSRNAADAKAEQAIKRGIDAGVLRSDDFSSLRPGYWVVFAGQYDSSEEATRAADRFAEQGFGGGYPRQVKPK